MWSFFVMLVLQGQKRDKLSLERHPFKPFNGGKGSKITQQYFHVKRV
jgi:hypothetical protein